jgi:hypothetical protein
MSTDRVSAVPGAEAPAATAVPSRWRRLAPVFALLVLAPWAAECSWGGFTAKDYPIVVIFLAPLYGGAAVLIREVARRMGAGWPAIVLLAAAFGVYQAGLVDQSLFDADFLADTEFADWAADSAPTAVPGLGINASDALAYVSNHVALSICAPIAVVESFLGPRRRHTPWLGARGLTAVGVLFVLGSLLIYSDTGGLPGFVASPLQLGGAALLVLALVGAAALPRWRRATRRSGAGAPHPIWAGLVVLAARLSADAVPGWVGVGIDVAVIAGVGVTIAVWSRRTGWGQRHVLAAWAAGLVAAAAGAYVVPNYEPASPTEALIGDVTISVVTLALVAGAFWRLRRERTTEPARSPA